MQIVFPFHICFLFLSSDVVYAFVLNYMESRDDLTYINVSFVMFINVWMPTDPKYIWLKCFPMKFLCYIRKLVSNI